MRRALLKKGVKYEVGCHISVPHTTAAWLYLRAVILCASCGAPVSFHVPVFLSLHRIRLQQPVHIYIVPHHVIFNIQVLRKVAWVLHVMVAMQDLESKAEQLLAAPMDTEQPAQ